MGVVDRDKAPGPKSRVNYGQSYCIRFKGKRNQPTDGPFVGPF